MKNLACVAVAAAILVAHPGFSQSPSSAVLMSDHAAARFLDQATWGPTPASIAQLQQMGIDNWLNAQFSLNTSDLPDQPVLASDGKPNQNLRPVQAAFFQNAVTGQDQLRQRVAFALSEIWVVSAQSGVRGAYAFPPYWRLFRDHAFHNYRDMIKAVSLNPAMGRFLNMANNNKANLAKGTAANENYARELMQLFTLGLNQLNLDGSPALDPNHHPVPTFDQNVVTNLAKALTGWTYPTAPGKTPRLDDPPYYIGQMFAVERNHDTSQKTIFGNYNIPAWQTAGEDLESVLDALMQQTTMAPFVCKQLIQHLVTSNPSPAYIGRIAGVFRDNGNGVRGDLRAVIAAILTDPEARAGDDPNASADANFGHLREPVLFLTNILRGLNATPGGAASGGVAPENAASGGAMSDGAASGDVAPGDANSGDAAPDAASANPALTTAAPAGGNVIAGYAKQLGQDLFRAPSVFSYFSPQYRIGTGLLAPEFQIYSTATAAQRADVVNSILYGAFGKTARVDLTPFLQHGNNTSALLDYIGYVFLHHSMRAELSQAAAGAANAARTPEARVQAALYIVLTSGEYQIVQ